jgi:hypothetical protein
MTIEIVSVVECENQIRVRACATAEGATIWLEVQFQATKRASKGRIWQEARDHCLRYLDIS